MADKRLLGTVGGGEGPGTLRAPVYLSVGGAGRTELWETSKRRGFQVG